MNWRRFFLAGFSALLLAACVTSVASGPASSKGESIAILISLDGFRPDYLDRGITPALSQLAADGVRASMRPSFPSVTFPNHYTLVTGLHPGRHGLVNNRMEDSQRPGVAFTLQDRSVASDEIWWADGTPIWVRLSVKACAPALCSGQAANTKFTANVRRVIEISISRFRVLRVPTFCFHGWICRTPSAHGFSRSTSISSIQRATSSVRTRLIPTPQSPKSMLR
jgi:hypothetical protein